MNLHQRTNSPIGNVRTESSQICRQPKQHEPHAWFYRGLHCLAGYGWGMLSQAWVHRVALRLEGRCRPVLISLAMALRPGSKSIHSSVKFRQSYICCQGRLCSLHSITVFSLAYGLPGDLCWPSAVSEELLCQLCCSWQAS